MWKIKVVSALILLGLAVPAQGSIIASLEQARIDVNTLSPTLSAPIETVLQIGTVQGGSFANTYGEDAFGRHLIRTMGAAVLNSAARADGTVPLVPRGPGDKDSQLVLVFGIEGFVESFDPGTGTFIALFDAGRAAVFEKPPAASFIHYDPDTWVPTQGDFDSPLIQWVLTDPIPIVPGQGEPLAAMDASQVNRGGANVSITGAQQGAFIFEEEIDPGYSVVTPDQDGFLDVTTGHEQFVGTITEGMVVTNSQRTTLRWTDEQLSSSQQDVLNAISNWAVGGDFATSFHVPGDSPSGFNPIAVGNKIKPFDGVDGGDFFANQDSLLLHPTLFGSVIPEPGTFVIWGLGLVGVAAFARTQRKSRKARAAE